MSMRLYLLVFAMRGLLAGHRTFASQAEHTTLSIRQFKRAYERLQKGALASQEEV